MVYHFVWQYIMSGNTGRTMVPVIVRGLSQSEAGGTDLDRGLEMAGHMLASLPMIIAFLLASKTFVQGMTAGAVKG